MDQILIPETTRIDHALAVHEGAVPGEALVHDDPVLTRRLQSRVNPGHALVPVEHQIDLGAASDDEGRPVRGQARDLRRAGGVLELEEGSRLLLGVRRRHGGREGNGRVVAQDGALELRQRGARIDPELVNEGTPRGAVGLERLGLPPERYSASMRLARSRSR